MWVAEDEKDNEEEKGDENDLMQVIGKLVMALLVKYWIYVCGGMFFFVSFEGKMVMYKIIYMMMFLSCVALYQVLHCCLTIESLESLLGYTGHTTKHKIYILCKIKNDKIKNYMYL